MKPAICTICGTPRLPGESVYEGAWVAFAEYVLPDPASEGHTRGLEYFCADHVSEALTLTPMLSRKAIAQLKAHFNADARSAIAHGHAQSWWQK